jgi:arylsulfatase A-like enzyme
MGSQDLFRPDPAASKQRILSFLKARDRRYKWADIVTGVYQATFKCGKLDVINHLKCLYDADILEFDTEIIGPLVKKLRDLGIYEKTIIVLCADHGDEFCEHGTQGHGTTLYEEVIHVPLIIKVPGLRGGKVVEELTQTVDIMPTIIELLGIPVPHRAQGKSLVPLMKGEATGTMRKYAFGHLPGDESYIRSKQWKLIRYWDGRKELFHISEDRGEERNLWSKRPDVGLMLEKELVAWEKSLPSFKVQSRFLPNIDEQTRKKIKETGYW